jgi:hypothetical protein
LKQINSFESTLAQDFEREIGLLIAASESGERKGSSGHKPKKANHHNGNVNA